MPTLPQAHAIVSREGWLSFAPPPFRQIVLARCKLQAHKAGAMLYSVGDPAQGGMFGLVSGSFALSMANAAPMSRISPGLAPGSAKPPPSPSGRGGSNSRSRAMQKCCICRCPRSAIVAADPGAWRFFGLASIAHIDTAIGGADDLLIRDHVKRSVAVLLQLGGCRYRTPRSAQPIEVDVSQEDFAAMTNTARTTAGTVLRALDTPAPSR